MIDTAQIDELIAKGRRVLVDKDLPASSCFWIPGTKNVAWLQVVKSYKGEGIFRLHISVSREGSSLMHSHYYSNDMTEQEMRKYLAGDEDAAEIRGSILELSEHVDDKEGEFPSGY